MEDFDIFFGHSVYFKPIWYILWPFGTFYGHLVFFPILVCCTRKTLATLVTSSCYGCANSDPKLPSFPDPTGSTGDRGGRRPRGSHHCPPAPADSDTNSPGKESSSFGRNVIKLKILFRPKCYKNKNIVSRP
jgi:hypothetical protein